VNRRETCVEPQRRREAKGESNWKSRQLPQVQDLRQ